MAEPSISDDPTGAPKRSDVIMRSLRRRPVNDKDPHDTLAAVHDFHVSRLEWSYIPDPAFIAELHARGCLFGGAAAAPSCAGGSDAETFARLNVVDRKGAPVIAPWKRTWTPHLWGCVNNPEYERRYVEYLYTYIDASVDIMHRDEPGANYLATQWGACFCAHCMAAFRGYLATHATPTQRAELGMGDVGAFDYRDYLAAQDAPVGDAFGPWDGDALKHLFVEFQLEATVAFHERTRRAADKRAGRHIVFSCNNGVRRWTAIERSFEWTTGELNCPDANLAFILEAVQRAESLGKRQVITMPKTADREHMDPLRLLTRETIAMAYACGTQCLVPWDVFMPGNGPRYFGTPEQYADLLGFVRATATYLDDHDYVEAGGFGFDPGPETQSFLKVEGGGRLCGVARRRPGDPTAPVVVHLIDWGQCDPATIRLRADRFFPGRRVSATLLMPATYDKRLHDAAEETGDYAALAESIELTVANAGPMARIELPPLRTWGLLLLTPGARLPHAERIVAGYTGIFRTPPEHIPTPKAVDGPLLGNGDVGVTLSGPPEAQRFWLSKNDFWQSQPGSRDTAVEYPYPNAGPCLIGGLDIAIPALKGGAYHVEQILQTAEVIAEFTIKKTGVAIRSWVAAPENLLVIQLSATGEPVHASITLWPQTGHGSVTTSGSNGAGAWMTREFKGPNFAWDTGVAVALQTLNAAETAFFVAPGKPVTLVLSIGTNHDRPDYQGHVEQRARDLTIADIHALRVQHEQWWAEFWAQSYVEIPDKLIEETWYGSHYIMACCSRNPNVPPGLFGNWITSDRPEWGGDFHLNYNHQAPWWGVYSSNHIELAEPYETPILEFMPQAKEFARRDLDVGGVYYPVGIGPKGLQVTDHFWGQKSNAAFVAANMFLRFYHTYDTDYAKRVYPYLIEVADFWEDYLEFEDGRYVVLNDDLYECNDSKDKNNPLSLGLLRMFFRGVLDISRELKCDAERHATWSHILEHLAPFATTERDGRLSFRGAEAGPRAKQIGATHVMFQGLVWPSGVLGLDSDPALLEAARGDLRAWPENRWISNNNAFPTTYPLAARLGHDPIEILTRLRKAVETTRFPNLWVFQHGGGIETCSGVTAGINEMLLQSYEGVLRFFPTWPAEAPARFGRLRTYGAFLVSSAYHEGEVSYALIESEKGRTCVLVNPWPGRTIAVHRATGAPDMLRGNRVELATAPGEQILLAPEGSDALELRARL